MDGVHIVVKYMDGMIYIKEVHMLVVLRIHIQMVMMKELVSIGIHIKQHYHQLV